MVHVSIKNATVKFDDQIAVNDISLSVKEGELVTLLGPSGCGKSTTLRMLAGFITPNNGDVIINDENVTQLPANKRDTALVFQNYALFPHMTVFKNVAYGLKMLKVESNEIEKRVIETLKMVDLEEYKDRFPSQLSGGQQQRVALARALIVEPKLLLLDEPLSNLDSKLREKMRFEIRQLQQVLGLTTIFVTHDQEEALVLSDKIVVMKAGKIIQAGTPEDVFEKPNTHFVADFIGVRNFFDGNYEDNKFFTANGSVIHVTFEDTKSIEKIGIRPNTIAVNPPDVSRFNNQFKGKIKYIVYKGVNVEMTVGISEYESVVTEIPSESFKSMDAKVGDEVNVCWTSDSVIPLFEESK